MQFIESSRPIAPAKFLAGTLVACLLLAAPRCSAQTAGAMEFSLLPSPIFHFDGYDHACSLGTGSCSGPYDFLLGVSGRVTRWVGRRVALEASALGVPGYGGLLPSARVLVGLAPRRAEPWVYLLGGPAVTGDGVFCCVIGISAHRRVAAPFALRAEFEHYGSPFQRGRTLVLSLGASFTARTGRAASPDPGEGK